MMLDDRAFSPSSPLGRPLSDEKVFQSERVRCTSSYPKTIHRPDEGSRVTGAAPRMAVYQGNGSRSE